MSAKTLSPPQTYSRLFRPWDGSKISNNNAEKLVPDLGDNKSSEIDNKKVHLMDKIVQNINENYTHHYDVKNEDFSMVMHAHDKETTRNQFIPIMDIPHMQQATMYDYVQDPLYYSKCSDYMRLPYVGVDSITAGLMEQEYARVLAEEAHTKMMSVRKQRPKKFKCPHCNVAFSNNGQLKGHIRIHTGERPFKCEEDNCGKTFTRNEELTRHKRIHTGLRPFACNTCGKRFGRRDHLKKHTKTHMVQERYVGQTVLLPMYPYLYGF